MNGRPDGILIPTGLAEKLGWDWSAAALFVALHAETGGDGVVMDTATVMSAAGRIGFAAKRVDGLVDRLRRFGALRWAPGGVSVSREASLLYTRALARALACVSTGLPSVDVVKPKTKTLPPLPPTMATSDSAATPPTGGVDSSTMSPAMAEEGKWDPWYRELQDLTAASSYLKRTKDGSSSRPAAQAWASRLLGVFGQVISAHGGDRTDVTVNLDLLREWVKSDRFRGAVEAKWHIRFKTWADGEEGIVRGVIARSDRPRPDGTLVDPWGRPETTEGRIERLKKEGSYA